MTIQDSSPERRNLTITSLGFILFFLGKGEFEGKNIKFQLVNITFKNPEVLSWFLWVMLFWFFWRYWLKFRGSYKYNETQEIQSQSCNLLTRAYVKFKTKLKYKKENGFNGVMFHGLNANYLSVSKIKEAVFDEKGKLKEVKSVTNIRLDVSFFPKQLLKLYTLVLMLFREPSITNVYVPYLLFIFAVCLGLERICT